MSPYLQGRDQYMENVTKIFVGVDVSKKRLDVHILPLKCSFAFANTKHGIKKLMNFLKSYDVVQVVCEASGGYESLMLDMLKAQEFKTWSVEPRRIKAFIYSEGKRAKTDTIDAQMIALFASQKVNPHEKIYEKHPKLHILVNRKKDFVEMITMERLRLQHPNENCKYSIKAHIAFMEKQVKSLEKAINKLISDDHELKKKINILESMPGVGRITSATFISELPELGNISNKQISSLVGVAPHPHESGQSKRKTSATGGRCLPRSALFMVALVASRHNPVLKLFYQHLIKSGKKAKVALGALMRKIIVILNVMLKNEKYWKAEIC